MSVDIQLDRDKLPYRCPECVSEDVAYSDSRSDLVCCNCGEEFDREEAVVIVGELESAKSGEEGERIYTVALLHTAELGPDVVKVKARDTWGLIVGRSPQWSSPLR